MNGKKIRTKNVHCRDIILSLGLFFIFQLGISRSFAQTDQTPPAIKTDQTGQGAGAVSPNPFVPPPAPLGEISPEKLGRPGQKPTDEFELSLALGNLYLSFKKIPEAKSHSLDALKMATEQNQKIRAYLQLADIGEQTAKPEDAIKYLEEIAKLSPDASLAQRVSARLIENYINIKNFAAAEQLLKQGVESSKDLAEKAAYQKRLFFLYKEQKTLDPVIAAYQKQLDAQPNDSEIVRTLALIYAEILGDRNKAKIYLQRLTAMKPSDIASLNALAAQLEANQQYNEAIDILNQNINLFPAGQRYFVYEKLYFLARNTQNTEKMIEFAEKKVELAGQDPNLLKWLIELYLDHNLLDKIEPKFQKILTATSDQQFIMGLIFTIVARLETLQDYDLAVSYLSKITALNMAQSMQKRAEQEIKRIQELTKSPKP